MTLYTPVVFTYKACKQHIPNQEYKNSDNYTTPPLRQRQIWEFPASENFSSKFLRFRVTCKYR